MDLKNIANGDVSQQLTAAQDAINKGGSAWSAFTNNIARKLTPEEATTYAASAAGLDLALATMMNMGYKPTQTQIDGMHKITAVTAADTKQTAVYKMLLAAQHAKEILKRMKIGTPEQLQGFKDAVSELEASYPNPLDWQKATVPGFGQNSMQKYMQEQMARSEQISKELEKSAMGLTKPVSPSAPTPNPTPVAQTEFNKDWAAHPGAEDRKQMREYAKAMNLKVPGEK